MIDELGQSLTILQAASNLQMGSDVFEQKNCFFLLKKKAFVLC